MDRQVNRTGKQTRPRTAVRGKRYLCAICHQRSPRAVTTPAPWYCPKCRPQTLSDIDDWRVPGDPSENRDQETDDAERG